MTNFTRLHCRLHCCSPRLHCCKPKVALLQWCNVPGSGYDGATMAVQPRQISPGCTVGCTVGCTAANPRIHWAFPLLVQPVAIFLLKVRRNKNWLCMVPRMYGYGECVGFGEFFEVGCTVSPKQHRLGPMKAALTATTKANSTGKARFKKVRTAARRTAIKHTSSGVNVKHPTPASKGN